MNPSEYQAIQWAKTNTPPGSVFVTDAEFGWWLSGFAQRPTLSAVDPQYLILKHEIAPAAVARNLLTADYMMDNGLIQIQQHGAYANGSTHEILAIINGSYYHPTVFSINDTQISILYRDNGEPKQLSLAGFTQTSTSIKNNKDNASFIITRHSQLFNITEEITIFKGESFAEVSLIMQGKSGAANFDWLQLPFQSRGFPVQYANSIAIVDNTLHVLNQIVFPQSQLGNDVSMQENPNAYELICNLEGNSTAQVNFFVGLSQFNPDYEITQTSYLNNLIQNNTATYRDSISDLPLNCFEYKQPYNNGTYHTLLSEIPTRLHAFADDPMFTLAFKNDQVAIFKTVKP